MDNEFADIEAELLRLQPRRPGARLEGRIADELSPTALAAPRRRSWAEDRRVESAPARYRTAASWSGWKWTNWAVAAALIALLATVGRRLPVRDGSLDTPVLAATTTATAANSPQLQPVKAGRVLLGSRVDGVVELADGSSVERVRDYYVDMIEWRDEQGTAQLRWEVPREAVRYVGLAAY